MVHVGPQGVDLARAIAERLSSIGVGAAVAGPVVPELVLCPEERSAQLDDRPLTFTRREYDLLLFLARNPHQVFTRGQLMHHVWGDDVDCGERTVDVHMRRVRAKLGGRGPVISTVRGVGYRLDGARRLCVAST
ncbi:winged helix-turn-helix domain-containing protein [Dactylosporangium cerinum]|uniref:Winged helix-turn-helix domain-containing protein n=1 Tax=Dactylosporangium cerinum TaxID=1434730 RepID=A0ABV9WEV3_9ACTN